MGVDSIQISGVEARDPGFDGCDVCIGEFLLGEELGVEGLDVDVDVGGGEGRVGACEEGVEGGCHFDGCGG